MSVSCGVGEIYEVRDFIQTGQELLGGEIYYDIQLALLDNPIRYAAGQLLQWK